MNSIAKTCTHFAFATVCAVAPAAPSQAEPITVATAAIAAYKWFRDTDVHDHRSDMYIEKAGSVVEQRSNPRTYWAGVSGKEVSANFSKQYGVEAGKSIEGGISLGLAAQLHAAVGTNYQSSFATSNGLGVTVFLDPDICPSWEVVMIEEIQPLVVRLPAHGINTATNMRITTHIDIDATPAC